MTARITLRNLIPTECNIETARMLEVDADDYHHITDESNGGACYIFTATGSVNTGTVYVDSNYVAIEWGDDPKWYFNDVDGRNDDYVAIERALNGELSDA